MDTVCSPLSPGQVRQMDALLLRAGIRRESEPDYTVLLTEGAEAAACGSLEGTVLKYIAVDPSRRGEDLLARILTPLIEYAYALGRYDLMLYTKPANGPVFRPFGFWSLARTEDCLLMENRSDSITRFLEETAHALPWEKGLPCACIVMHADPFTVGHRHLVETAARETGRVVVFVLSEDGGMFAPDERLALVKAGCADIGGCAVLRGSRYLISRATFPTYFLKAEADPGAIQCALDVTLFGETIAPALNIRARYVGTEPTDPVTCRYNEMLASLLPLYGITLREVERLTADGTPVCASAVREAIRFSDTAVLKRLLPASGLASALQRCDRGPACNE